MEEESFSDESVAEVMNKYFISIKVDREERPDIDEIYMRSSLLINGSGGWPLNVIALPDGRPVFAGTYFPKNRWINILKQTAYLYKENRDELERAAGTIGAGLINIERSSLLSRIDKNKEKPFEINKDVIKSTLDNVNGGLSGAPKFPMPSFIDFIMEYYSHTNEKFAADFLNLTLIKMAYGGIYDQLGGGFARYSTDNHWKVPHFEKMLYDNAQLLSVYSRAYRVSKKKLYIDVMYGIVSFLDKELKSTKTPKGMSIYYSSIDADSEGEEGLFYTWKFNEIKKAAEGNSEIIKNYYNLEKNGNWEDGRNIFFRKRSSGEIAKEFNISTEKLNSIVGKFKIKMGMLRNKKVRPRTDTKILTSWNAMLVSGFVDAYKTLGDKVFLKKAEGIVNFILRRLVKQDGTVFRSYSFVDKNPAINGFLDDYSYVIRAFLDLYSVTFDEKYLEESKKILNICFARFYDKKSGMFFFSEEPVVSHFRRTREVSDGVIPSSNSIMASNLIFLGEIYFNDYYIKTAKKMVDLMKQKAQKNPAFYAKWGSIAMNFGDNLIEAVFTGTNALKNSLLFSNKLLPGIVIAGKNITSKLPILKNKGAAGKSLIYICRNRTCLMPVSTVQEALKLLKIKNNDK